MRKGSASHFKHFKIVERDDERDGAVANPWLNEPRSAKGDLEPDDAMPAKRDPARQNVFARSPILVSPESDYERALTDLRAT